MATSKKTTAKTTAAKGNKKFGAQRNNKRRSIVAMRNKGASWAEIGAKFEIAPRTVRRMFDEAQGEGAHFASRVPGKGGRTRQTTED